MTYKIMVVDDEPANLRLLERLFRREYHVLTASSGEEALRLLSQHDVALLVTDQRMPGMTGIELIQQAAELRPHVVRIILTGYTDVGALVEAINCGQVYKYVTKPWDNESLRLTVGRAVEHFESTRSRHELGQANERLTQRLREMTRSFVRTIGDALEARDEHVSGHARRVSSYVTAIGRRMRVPLKTLETFSLAALLHDLGMIGVPDSILLKPRQLDEAERALMRQHAERGARMLAGVPGMEEVAEAVRHHHERWDGGGYPEGLSGEMIPLASRLIHVADAYDAMTSPRSFREALPHEEAVARLREQAGGDFDPDVVRAFCELGELARIRQSIARGYFGDALTAVACHPGEAPLAELVTVAEGEPVLAAAVLRAANETARERPAESVRAACERLGESRVRGLASQHCATRRPDPNAERLVAHSVRCAEAARSLAERTGLFDSEVARTLGLLHDLGEVLLGSLFPEEMEKILWFSDDERPDREVAAFGVDHAQVGQWALDSAGLPRALTAAVQMHHDAARVNTPLALLLNVADSIASASDSTDVAALDHLGTDRLLSLGLSRADVAQVQEQVERRMEERMAVA